VLAYSDAAFEDGRATGRGLSLEDAIAFALAETGPLELD
jgi:hypothetical protein